MQVALLILKSGLLLCHTLFVILYVLYPHCSKVGMQRGNRAVQEDRGRGRWWGVGGDIVWINRGDLLWINNFSNEYMWSVGKKKSSVIKAICKAPSGVNVHKSPAQNKQRKNACLSLFGSWSVKIGGTISWKHVFILFHHLAFLPWSL